jgi:predicted secreted Zn-dependent protease
LPRWSNRRRTNSDLALIWDTLAADIKRHEERHAEIARGYARDLDQKLRALRPQADCETMQKMVAEVSQEVMDAHDKDQVRFDKIESKNFDARMTRLLKNRIQQRAGSR